MWIITHDNVHDAVSNPAHNIPRSKDYLEKMCRKKNTARKHVFRLMHKGREMFRGVAYFENDASFAEILRPLDEFGRSEYDCDEIQYMIKDLSETPNGRQVWNPIHEQWARALDYLITDRTFNNMRCVLDAYHVEFTCEMSRNDILSVMNADRR